MKKVVKYIVTSGVFIITTMGVNGKIANAGIRSRISGFFRNINCLSCLRKESLNKGVKVKVAKGLTGKVNDLYGRKLISGVDVRNFDVEGIDKFNKNNWYLQRVNSKGEKVTLTATEKPVIFGIVGETVHQKYTKENGNEVTVFHTGIPNWIPGDKLKDKVKASRVKNKVGIDNLGFNDKSLSGSTDTSKSIVSTGSSGSGSSFLGERIYSFDSSNIKKIKPDYWYHQHKTSSGKLVTLISDTNPDEDNAVKVIIKTGGDPQVKNLHWVSGEDLLKAIKNKKKLVEK